MEPPRTDELTAHGTIALVPLRTGGKSRLAGALPSELRDELVLAMLDDVVTALRTAGVRDIRVLAGNTAARTAAAARGLDVLDDPGPSPDGPDDGPDDGRDDGRDTPLRAAVDAALRSVDPGATRLVVAADLPRLRSADIAAVLSDPADVVVVPTAGGGTAVLRLAPDVTLAARYGAGSAAAHVAEARRTDLRVAVHELPGAGHDVDAAPDLDALARPLDGAPPGTATTAFLTRVRG